MRDNNDLTFGIEKYERRQKKRYGDSFEKKQRRVDDATVHASESKNCENKTPYRSEKHAHDVIRSVERKRNVKLRSYLCAGCHWWHITSKKKITWIGE